MRRETLMHPMRTLISLLALAMMTIGLPALHTTERAALAAPSVRTVQARGKKKRPRPTKAKKAVKKDDKKAKKSDRGFEL